MKKIIIIAIAAVLIAAAAILFTACSKKIPEEVTCGGWTKEKSDISEEELAIFNDAMQKEVVDTQFLPKKIIGRQVVAGMNYKFLCTAGSGEEARQVIVQIYHDLEGGNQVTGIYDYFE